MAKLPCPPELWPEFSALLDEALCLEEEERAPWLASLGREHAAVRPWLAKVITDGGTTLEPDFLRGPAADVSAETDFVAGQQLGPYQLQRRLGSGGMGEVWLAARSDGTLNRQVALKLPHGHLIAGVLRRRFERERDILAALSHPNIAQLYDAGVAQSKHPYLAMEWVDGVALQEHCAGAQLSLEHRLDLFLQVLDAVGYAHGRLIAHRDLKPSNILVTREGARVKLLDFGIAKLLTGDTDNGATQLTKIGSCLATPGYAAPEQLAGEPITAAVDLYALGVVLHELLTGARPFRPNAQRRADSSDTARASSKIAPDHAATMAGLTTKQLRRTLTGDLDAIIAKALEPDPNQRYRSAEAFALDIRRSRRHRPISARHISALSLLLMFTRRHWVGVALTSGLMLAIIAGSAGIAWQAVRAEREAQRATTIKDFLIGVFRASDPRIAADKPRGEITARELLDASTKQIESGFAKQPETQIELLGVIADIYWELDETKQSSALYGRETELAQKYLGAADSHTIDGLLGQAYTADGDNAQALALLTRADPLIHQAHLDNSASRARWLLTRGETLFYDAEKGEEAHASLQSAANLFKAVAPKDLRYPDSLSDLGALALEHSQFAEAAEYYRQAIAVSESDPQFEGDLLSGYAGLAQALEELGDFKEASVAFERGTEVATRTYGRGTRFYWAIASDWAQLRYQRGEREPALTAFETLLRDAPAANDSLRSPMDTLEVAELMQKYGDCLAVDGQTTRSIEFLEAAQTLLQKSAAHAFDVGRLQIDLGSAYAAGGRTADAGSSFAAGLANLTAQKAPASRLARATESRGRYLALQGDTNGAGTAFDEALRLSNGHSSETAVSALAGLALIAVSRGDSASAMVASKQAMQQLDHVEGNYDIRLRPYVWSARARALLQAGDTKAALALATRAHDATLLEYAPGSKSIADSDSLMRNLQNRQPATTAH